MSALDEFNDQFQQAPDPDTGRAVLAALTLRQLRALADLNHVDSDTRRDGLIRALMADPFGE